ncbi:MAG TPA: glycosyl hydrolase [Burkholderiaceae bacterium]
MDPATHHGPKGSGEPWKGTKACASPPPPDGLVFGSYKDITINLNWNTNVLSTKVTGMLQPVLDVMPARQHSATWAFATGECGSENWAGVTPGALVSANVSKWVAAGRKYIISTGGAAGSFSCGSDAGFEKFIATYDSASLQGIDFDIEAGQSQSVIDNLVARVKAAQPKHPTLRFSFTLATLGGNAPQSLGTAGQMVMASIKSHGLTNYLVNLMTMDYGSAIPSNCTLGPDGQCDMGKSAINAAINLHNYWGVPYGQIEITPMIGGNDTEGETFTLEDTDEVSAFVLANKLSGVHFWSLDRDNDCAPGWASPTCNSYGQAGTWGFTNRFITKLGQ